MQEKVNSFNFLIPINNPNYEKVLIEKLRNTEDIYDVLFELSDEKISILIQYFMNKVNKNSNPDLFEQYFEEDYIKILINTLIFRIKKDFSNNYCCSVLSNISIDALKKIYEHAPMIVLETSFHNLMINKFSLNEIQLLNENPVFFKNKFMQIYSESPSSDLSHFTTKISNLKTLELIAKEMDYNHYFKHFQPQIITDHLTSKFLRSEIVLQSNDVYKDINRIITPYLLMNPSVVDVSQFLNDAPRGILDCILNSVVKLMGMKRYPIKYIPISSNLCVYSDMNYLNLIKDNSIAEIQAAHICKNYYFAVDSLLETLYESNRLTGFINHYGDLLLDCQYSISQMALKSSLEGSSCIEDWAFNNIRFNDRIAADIASLLLKHIPYSIKTLFKLAESGSVTIQTIGNAIFTDISLWTQFCEYFENKEDSPNIFTLLCSNILKCNQKESALKAISIAAKTIFKANKFEAGKDHIYSILKDSMDNVILKEEYMKAYVEAFISFHPLSSVLLPFEEIIQECSKTCFFQVLKLLSSESSNPKILLLKIRLFHYRYQQDPQQHALHYFNYI